MRENILCPVLQTRPYFTPARNNKAQSQELGFVWGVFGAGERSRTPDLLITNELLYQLSYTGLVSHAS
jgi:hypothetical protein